MSKRGYAWINMLLGDELKPKSERVRGARKVLLLSEDEDISDLKLSESTRLALKNFSVPTGAGVTRRIVFSVYELMRKNRRDLTLKDLSGMTGYTVSTISKAVNVLLGKSILSSYRVTREHENKKTSWVLFFRIDQSSEGVAA